MAADSFSLTEYKNLTNTQMDNFLQFCKESSLEDLPAAKNMWHDQWQSHSETLPFILNNTDRFKNSGTFHILLHDNQIVLCGGVYKSEFSKNIALAGTRTWVKKEYRNLSLIRDYLLPEHKAWSIKNGCKQIVICFNEYNKNLRKIFYRNRLGEPNNRIFNRSEQHLFHSNINELPFAVNIQDTPQWILYEKIDPNWEFDWTSLKCF
jgi:hypothetical protein